MWWLLCVIVILLAGLAIFDYKTFKDLDEEIEQAAQRRKQRILNQLNDREH